MLEFSGRLRASDFTDPAAAVIFRVVMDAGPAAVGAGLPAVLHRQGLLRPDAYPLSEFLEWLPGLPVPVHPRAWATLVVAGTLGRRVSASGVRLLQAVEAGRERSWPVGKVLAVVAAQRAATTSSWHRWEELPASWRDTVASLPDRSTTLNWACADISLPRSQVSDRASRSGSAHIARGPCDTACSSIHVAAVGVQRPAEQLV